MGAVWIGRGSMRLNTGRRDSLQRGRGYAEDRVRSYSAMASATQSRARSSTCLRGSGGSRSSRSVARCRPIRLRVSLLIANPCHQKRNASAGDRLLSPRSRTSDHGSLACELQFRSRLSTAPPHGRSRVASRIRPLLSMRVAPPVSRSRGAFPRMRQCAPGAAALGPPRPLGPAPVVVVRISAQRVAGCMSGRGDRPWERTGRQENR